MGESVRFGLAARSELGLVTGGRPIALFIREYFFQRVLDNVTIVVLARG
jgi:hypothetical protein